MTKADKLLAILLRFVGAGTLFALVPVFIPFSWMIATHTAILAVQAAKGLRGTPNPGGRVLWWA